MFADMHLIDYILFRFGPGAASVLAVLLMLAMYAPLLVIGFSTKAAARSGSYLRWNGTSRKIFSPPPAFAVGLVTFVLWIIMLIMFFPGKGSLSELLTNWWSALPQQAQLSYLLYTSLLTALFYWVVIQWLRRKCALVLDMSEKRYRTLDISSLAIKAQAGTWDDIAGIYIRRAKSGRGSEAYAYFVCLKWRGSSKAYSALGGFGQQDRAKAYAEKVAQELRLPLVSETMQ